MKRNKKTIFTKSIYAAFALLVLLVAAGIASYAVAPPGAATHATLYTDVIQGKTAEIVAIGDENALSLGTIVTPRPNGILQITDSAGSMGIKIDVDGTGIEVKGENGIKSSSEISLGLIAVEGTHGTNIGKLGTSVAGVEGSSSLYIGQLGGVAYGVEGRRGVGGTTYGRLGTLTDGVYGEGTGNGVVGKNANEVNTYGVLGGINAGIFGSTNNAVKYGGYFQGGKGLYASDIRFGTNAFQATANEGSLILGVSGTGSCTNVCSNHGLGCLAAYLLDGTNPAYNCGAPGVGALRYCWCGSA